MIAFVTLSSISVRAQEICGLQSVGHVDAFKDSFETLGTVAARSQGTSKTDSTKPSQSPKAAVSGKPMGIAKAINAGGAPTITITSPLAGANVAGKRVQVRGTYSGPENTGVRVNEMTAFVHGGEFVTPDIKIDAGNFDIVAIATTLDGLTASVTRSINGGVPATPQVTFGTGVIAGLNELTVPFALEIADGVAPQSVSIDFDGNATPDYVGSVPSAAQLRYRYATPGIYVARATVTSANMGNPVYVADRLVVVIDLSTHRNLICSPYGALRTRLTANDVPGAIRVFPSSQRPTYEAYFNALGTNRPVFATRLGTIGNGMIGLTEANLMLVANGANGPIGYPLRVAQSNDGVWRIESL